MVVQQHLQLLLLLGATLRLQLLRPSPAAQSQCIPLQNNWRGDLL